MPTRAQLEEHIRFASERLASLHGLAVERGDFEVHFASDEPPMIVTEFMSVPTTTEELEALGIRCHIAGRNALCPTCGQPADLILKEPHET